MIRFACPTCQKTLKAPEKAAGRKVHCPRCTQLLIVPVPYEIKSKPVLGLLLPSIIPSSSPPEQDDSVIEHSFDDFTAPTEYNPHDPLALPPVRQEPPNTSVGEGNTDSFVMEEPPEPPSPTTTETSFPEFPEQYEYPAPKKHSFQGIVATLGAIVMILLLIFCWEFIQPPPPWRPAAARVVASSCAFTGLVWAFLSFLPGNKKFRSIAACIGNIALLLIAIFRR